MNLDPGGPHGLRWLLVTEEGTYVAVCVCSWESWPSRNPAWALNGWNVHRANRMRALREQENLRRELKTRSIEDAAHG